MRESWNWCLVLPLGALEPGEFCTAWLMTMFLSLSGSGDTQLVLLGSGSVVVAEGALGPAKGSWSEGFTRWTRSKIIPESA